MPRVLKKFLAMRIITCEKNFPCTSLINVAP